jgi:hypothetical protein
MAKTIVQRGEFDELRDRVDKHHKTFYGNGVPGWDEILRGIDTELKARKAYETEQRDYVKQREKEQRDTILYMMRVTIGAALTALVVLIVNGLVWFMKILPLLDSIAKP